MWITFDKIMLDNVLRMVHYGIAEMNDAGQYRIV